LRAAEEDLWLWPLSPSYRVKPTREGFILGFGSTDADDISPAVQRFHKLLGI
jgi:DNA-binding transcriptional MocR family regulator